MKMVKVKVCGMTNAENISAICKLSPDFIGFIFYPGSKRFVGSTPDKSLFSAVPQGILKTGVFVNDHLLSVISIARLFGLDAVQLHGDEPASYCTSLQREGLKVIKAFGISNTFDFRLVDDYSESCDFFLFDTKTDEKGGSGISFDWLKLDDYHLKKPFFLAGGIGPDDAARIRQIKNDSLYAVDLNSCFEVQPGIKDKEKISVFIDEINKKRK